MDSMGIVKCGAEDLEEIEQDQIILYRHNKFGCEVLTRNKRSFAVGHPEMVIDPVTTEAIMLFYSRGEEL